ncbi:flagellar basal body-associated FliL family protein [Maritalea mediterranea]|uniref:Flagellar protein FliL n=1 Tax=Maritalea mediterranea TaxID=2909667 RepID=A0ABS9E9D2_9HYPH|nr:flagellar basal body-associated FliL family protein [Maritalea mediterranea]MCF4098812.1 flagellar basal body-associated FliL family protein [Maritalea mediterranea]
MANEDANIDPIDGEEGEAKKKKPPMMIIIGGAVLLLAAIGAAVYFFMFANAEQDNAELQDVRAAIFYDLPTITVNLNDDADNDEVFLKLAIALELSDESLIEIVEPRMPRVLDTFQVYLRELRRSDLEGSAGIYRLKEELRRRVNLAVFPAQVDSILFKEILVQ